MKDQHYISTLTFSAIAYLVEGCKKGNRQAQEKVYNMYAKKMHALCLRYAKDTMEAEDILMEGFAKVFLKIDTYSGLGSFEGWIRSIIIHAALSSHSRSLRRIRTASYDDMPYLKEAVTQDYKSDLDYLVKALNDLPNPYKMAFNLFVLEGYTHREIGELLCIKEGLSKLHVSRARKMLKDNLNRVAMQLSEKCFAP